MDDDTVELLRAMFRATPEERKAFWEGLEKWAIDNGIEPGIYCPYVPLQVYGADDRTGFIQFKTRYSSEG